LDPFISRKSERERSSIQAAEIAGVKEINRVIIGFVSILDKSV